MTYLRDYLERNVLASQQIGFPAIMERFVLRNGKPYTPGHWPRALMTPKQCFANAAQSLDVGPYVEGYVARGGIPIPIHHAWNAGPNDTALDATLRPPLDPKYEGLEYFGVEFSEAELLDTQRRTGVYGVLVNDYGMINIETILAHDPGMTEFLPPAMRRIA